MSNLHNLLKRQLKRHFGAQFTIPDEWKGFIDSINAAYHEFDGDREMLEHSLEMSSQELIEANAETRSLIQLFPDAFIWLDRDGAILNFKSSGDSSLDWLQQGLNVESIQKMSSSAIRGALLRAIDNCLISESVSTIDFAVEEKGWTKYYEARVIPPLSDRILVLVRDITDRKETERRLEESEQRFRRLAENAPDVILRFEILEPPHFSYVSPAITRLTGYTPEEFYAEPLLGKKIVHPDDLNYYRPQSLEEMPRSSSTIRWQHKDGNYVWVEQRLVPVLDKSGNLIAIESITRDVTNRIQAEKQIQDLYEKEKAQRQELEEETRARSQFIDVLAHELRTPLTPVLITMQALHDVLAPSEDAIKAKLIKSAYKGANSLAARLEELLDLARFSRGAVKLNMQQVNTCELLENAAGGFIPALVPKRQSLKIDVAYDLPSIKADRSRLEQVITNLLSNASKYSPEDTEITISARKKDRDIVVEIKDQGIGISSEDQQRLFQPYHRVEQDRQSFPGIGLGLAVCKQIVEAHQGRIWIESERGKGSIFKFSIPVQPN